MTQLPVVKHLNPAPSPAKQARAEQLAEDLLRRHPELAVPDELRPLVPEELHDAPSLHLDDLSDIPLLSRAYDVRFMQERARLRAGDGDFFASSVATPPEYEEYCRDRLALGAPTWLRPRPGANALRLASACWADRSVRRTLVRELRSRELLYIHPHMAIRAVWELAVLLHGASRCPVKVVGAPPGVTKWVNNKLAFAETVERLFGPRFVPRTEHAGNFAALARRVRDLAANCRLIALKLPDSAGSGGNLVLEAERFRGRSLGAIRSALKRRLATLQWQGERVLLVGHWEDEVLSSPSAQFWIPPEPEGPPVGEGLYEQAVEGPEAFFVGSRPARFPDAMTQEMVDRCWLLARLYQQLGYVGRCSFDMLWVGPALERSRLEFVECNGRWGGTSLPMTLMNRLFGDWADQPYAARECGAPGLERLQLADLLNYFADDLFDARTRRGNLIFYNPGRLQAHAAINVLALAEDWEAAWQLVRDEVPRRLRKLAADRGTTA